MSTRFRFRISFALSLALLVAGLLLKHSRLALLSLPGFFYAFGLLVSHLLLPGSSYRVSRTLSRSRMVEGDSTQITVELEAPESSTATILVEDSPPSGAVLLSGDPRFIGRIAPEQKEQVLRYTIQGRRGEHEFAPLRVTTWPWFGLAFAESHVHAPGDLRVLPHVEGIDEIPIHPPRTRAFAGPIRAHAPGSGIEFYGCRNYTPGDDIRRINWRAFARTDELVICDFEQEQIADVSLILDARRRSHAQIGEVSTFEAAIRASASLSHSFCIQGHSTGLLIYGDTIDWVFPGIGRAQDDRIQDALSHARLADKLPFEELRRIPTRLFPARSQLVLISCQLDDDDIETLALLKERGYALLLISVNTIPLECDHLPGLDAETEAVRIAQLRRGLYHRSLLRFGLDVVDWDPRFPLRHALRQVALHRGRQSR